MRWVLLAAILGKVAKRTDYRVKRKEATETKNPDSRQNLDYLFNPKSIAIVGVSADEKRIADGRIFLESLIDFGFKGKIYPVNRVGGEVLGLKLYPDIRDIPDTVDHVIAAIPAQHTPQLLLDCASKGVKAMHIFSSGFSEIADKEGEKLESELTSIARQTGIRVIGPNCMGLFYPKNRITFLPESPRQSGPVGFISQSGHTTGVAITEGAMRGVYLSKAISYGNACDLNECDFLEYLTHDPETKIIAGYIEGVDDGTHFIQTLKQAVKVKPVIFYKAGTTEYGSGAVASHTGTMAGSNKIWESLLKQVGVIQVHSMEELIDVILPFIYMSPSTGRNIALIGRGGGAIVQSADECAKAGLYMPPLPLDIRQKLEEIYTSETGGSFRNPIDMYWGRSDLIRKAIKIMADYKQIDLLMMQMVVSNTARRWEMQLKQQVEAVINLGKEINRRTAVVLRLLGPASFWVVALEALTALVKAGFPVYPSTARAANAIVKFTEYHQRQKVLTEE